MKHLIILLLIFPLALPAQLRINEIMADPTPLVGLPDAEFIELFNASADTVQVGDYSLADATKSVALPFYDLPPNGYLLLCGSSKLSDFQFFGPSVAVKNFPSLSNTGEPLRLWKQGSLIDSVFYSPNWHADAAKKAGGWTLERINPLDTCLAMAQNWRSSVHPSGGTPGQRNSVFSLATPSDAPKLLRAEGSAQQWTLHFSQAPTLASALRWASQHKLAIEARTDVAIGIALPLAEGEGKSIDMRGLENCYGIPVADTAILLAFGAQPQFLDLVITEIMADPTPAQGLPETEYVEIHNRTERYLSLQEVSFFAGNDRIALQGFLPPKAYLTLVPEKWLSKFKPSQGVPLPSLSNEGERIGLIHSKIGLLYSVHYSSRWYQDAWKKEGGFSLEMLDADYPCLEDGNWLASAASRGGTPGDANSQHIRASDRTPPQLLRILPLDSVLELRFSESLHAKLLEQAAFLLDGKALGKALLHAESASRLHVTLPAPLEKGMKYELKFTNIADCAQNAISATKAFWTPLEADSADVVFNELLPQPFVGGHRFVEVYNRSEKPVNLQNWQLCRLSESGAVDRYTNLSEEMLVLPPKHFQVFTYDKASLLGHYPNAAEIEEVGRELPVFGFGAEEAHIALRSSDGRTIDEMRLSEQMAYSLIDEHEGVSLERLSAHAPSGDWSNWRSAATQQGYATPGLPNSQHLQEVAQEACWQAYPTVITPNQDGHNDFVALRYACTGEYTTANIWIFDEWGRQVRHLAQQALLGAEGFVVWDGTGEAGAPMPTGLYMVLVEGFQLNGRTFRERLCVAVAR